MALVNINEGLKEEYSMNKIFSAEYDFSCVRQIACADRFAHVLTCAIAHVKRKGVTFMHSMYNKTNRHVSSTVLELFILTPRSYAVTF